ncbi:hypothetical protein [Streptosporangium sp. KLBMP 9127]|nr:hypothetical protein [Streptosporangium sp. KLBMP 9127]
MTTGRVGEVGCLSLQRWKHITQDDDGPLITDDDRPARVVRLSSDVEGWEARFVAGDDEEVAQVAEVRVEEDHPGAPRSWRAPCPEIMASTLPRDHVVDRGAQAGDGTGRRLLVRQERLDGTGWPGTVG